MPVLGQLLWVTPASWLKAPKRWRRGWRTSLASALGGEREGTTAKGQLAGQIACREHSCSWQPLPAHGRRPRWLPVPSVRRGGGSRGGRGFGLHSAGCGAVSRESLWSAASLAVPGNAPSSSDDDKGTFCRCHLLEKILV